MQKRGMPLFFIFSLLILNLITIPQATASPTRLEPINEGGIKAPFKIALDAEGKLYVTEPSENRLVIYSRNGQYINTLGGLSKPLAVAVDSSGRIYIGEADKGSVSVYNPDLQYSHKLGAGDGEFGKPLSIAIGNTTGDIYVADSKTDKVKVYDSTGALKFSFGSTGNANGQFNTPTDIAIDEIKSEVLISDLQQITTSNGLTAGARIQIFDMEGAYKRSFGSFGIGDGMMVRPLGLTVDTSGQIYVTDSYTSVVHIFDTAGSYQSTLYDTNNPMSTPIGVKIGKDGRVFIACLNGYRIEVYGLTEYVTMTVSPQTISFQTEQGAASPTSQGITISNTGTGTLNWTATTQSSWITLTEGNGVTGPSTSTILTIGANTTGLIAGTYTATVEITATTGAKETITVNLTITTPPDYLSVTPNSLTYKAQKDGPAPTTQTININNLGGSGQMSWTASAEQQWLSINSTSGIAPSTVLVSVNPTGLQAGTYTATIEVTAPGAQGSPATVNISLKVINAGTLKVTTNLNEAGFDIAGPANYTGTGKNWSTDEAAPGNYTITFRHVSGYTKPATKTFTVQTGKETAIDGQYRAKQTATHIIAGSGGTKGKKVVVLTLDGTQQVASFEPFKSPESIKVQAGDLDGSGTDKIIVTDHKKSIKVYTSQGAELASLDMSGWYKNTEIAVADIDNDAIADIIVGAKNEYNKDKVQREIKLLGYSNGKLQEKNTLYTEEAEGEFTLSLGDTNGDGIAELIMADKEGIRAFTINTAEGKVTQIWANSGSYEEAPQIATGDINDDGIAEIALSIEVAGSSSKGSKDTGTIKILKGTGQDYGIEIDAYGDLGYEKPSTVALGDIDGDKADEIVAGAGRDEHNEALIRMFESDGTFTGTTIKATDSKYGVNVSLGRFK